MQVLTRVYFFNENIQKGCVFVFTLWCTAENSSVTQKMQKEFFEKSRIGENGTLWSRKYSDQFMYRSVFQPVSRNPQGIAKFL